MHCGIWGATLQIPSLRAALKAAAGQQPTISAEAAGASLAEAHLVGVDVHHAQSERTCQLRHFAAGHCIDQVLSMYRKPLEAVYGISTELRCRAAGPRRRAANSKQARGGPSGCSAWRSDALRAALLMEIAARWASHSRHEREPAAPLVGEKRASCYRCLAPNPFCLSSFLPLAMT